MKDNVRVAAFVILSEKCSLTNLTIAQRVHILEAGLNDRSDLVQDACVSRLLRSWSLDLDGDFMRLLLRLDPENSPEVAEKAFFKLFDNLYSNKIAVKKLREFMEESSPGKQQEERQGAVEDGLREGDSPVASLQETPSQLGTKQVSCVQRGDNVDP